MPGMLSNIRTSFVFINKETFETYYKVLKDMKVNSYFSLILIDNNKGIMLEEKKITEDRTMKGETK